VQSIREGNDGYGLEEHGKAVAFSMGNQTKAEGKTAVWREGKKCFKVLEAGQWEGRAKAIFYLTGIRLCAVPKCIDCHYTFR